MTPTTPSPGQLTSPYPPPFHRGLLVPRLWPAWLGLGLFRLITLLPWRARRTLGIWAGDLIRSRNAKRRTIVLTNLAWCFPEKSEAERLRLARDYFRTMACSALDCGVAWWGSRARVERLFRLEGEEHLAPHLAAGRPVILLTCHHVALDIGGIGYSLDHPLVTIFKGVRNPLLKWFMARGRARFGAIIYERADNLRLPVRATRAGYALFYLPDEDLGPERSLFVPFFGVPAATIPALGRLARMCNAAVLPYMPHYDANTGRYSGRLFPALEGFPSGDELADTARMNAAIEALVRLAPEQYMWSMRIFQTRPDGSPPPYAMKNKPGSGPRERPESPASDAS